MTGCHTIWIAFDVAVGFGALDGILERTRACLMIKSDGKKFLNFLPSLFLTKMLSTFPDAIIPTQQKINIERKFPLMYNHKICHFCQLDVPSFQHPNLST